MARAFTEREREIIRQKLIEEGREAFSTFGIKKTSVDDLTQAVGISKGSFYAFFRSKEDLYLEILEAEESRLREVMVRALSNQPITKQSLKAFIIEGLRLMETNPLLRRMHEQDELNQFLQAVSPDRFAQHIQKDEDWMRHLVAAWQEQGAIIDGDPQAIAGAISLIITSSLYRDSLGGENYPGAINLLVDLVVSWLTTETQGLQV